MDVQSTAGVAHCRAAPWPESGRNSGHVTVLRPARHLLGRVQLEGFPGSSSLIAVTFVGPSLQERASTPLDPELKIITHLIRVTAEVGIQTDPVSIVNFYVALKSKPLAILTGIAQSGKVALVRILAQALIGDDLRCQMMRGMLAGRQTAMWPSPTCKPGSTPLCPKSDRRSWAARECARVYIACLACISPAELTGFFSELACQLQHGQIMQLPSIHLTQPIAYPSNLLLIGTMDTVRLECRDVDLLTKTIIQWSAVESKLSSGRSTTVTPLDHDGEFLLSCIRDESSARLKLLRILGNASSIRPMLQIADLLERYDAPVPDSVIGETVVYLANAWSKQGVGLFDRANSRNVAIAADLAIAQTILPHIGPILRSVAALYDPLKQALKPFPYSLTLLENLN
jgi:hypothetical protein